MDSKEIEARNRIITNSQPQNYNRDWIHSRYGECNIYKCKGREVAICKAGVRIEGKKIMTAVEAARVLGV